VSCLKGRSRRWCVVGRQTANALFWRIVNVTNSEIEMRERSLFRMIFYLTTSPVYDEHLLNGNDR
jgi:hypothetical protein